MQNKNLNDFETESLCTLGALISLQKVADRDMESLQEILLILKQRKKNKLKALHHLLKQMLNLKQEGYELFHSYQTITILLQIPDDFLQCLTIVLPDYIAFLVQEEKMNLSDDEKVIILIDNFLLNQKNDIKRKVSMKMED